MPRTRRFSKTVGIQPMRDHWPARSARSADLSGLGNSSKSAIRLRTSAAAPEPRLKHPKYFSSCALASLREFWLWSCNLLGFGFALRLEWGRAQRLPNGDKPRRGHAQLRQGDHCTRSQGRSHASMVPKFTETCLNSHLGSAWFC